MGALMALLAALFGFASCGAVGTRIGIEDESRARPGCTSPWEVRADVDGDGRDDAVFAEDAAEQFTVRALVVCFADGRRVAKPDMLGAGTPLIALDVNGDGDSEVATGRVDEDRTVFEVFRWNGTRFVRMPGLYLTDDSPGTIVRQTFGCDPPRTLVQVFVAWPTRTAYVTSLEVDEYRVLRKTQRTVRVPAGADRARYAYSLVNPCPTLRGTGGPGS